MADHDYDEEQVWDVLDCSNNNPNANTYSPPPSSSSLKGRTHSRIFSAKAKVIPRSSSSSSHGEQGHNNRPQPMRQSAPIGIPDWSKIYGAQSQKTCYNEKDHNNGEDTDDDDYRGIPPHEWLAKKLAKSQITSFSVCEGVGRTLKGRDLSKVRNAVLTRTGFIE